MTRLACGSPPATTSVSSELCGQGRNLPGGSLTEERAWTRRAPARHSALFLRQKLPLPPPTCLMSCRSWAGPGWWSLALAPGSQLSWSWLDCCCSLSLCGESFHCSSGQEVALALPLIVLRLGRRAGEGELHLPDWTRSQAKTIKTC